MAMYDNDAGFTGQTELEYEDSGCNDAYKIERI